MKKLFNFILITPVIIYSVFLIALPLIYIFMLSFLKNDFYGGIINEVTFSNYLALFDAVYIKVFLKSFLIALITTTICILISYPFCIFISKKNNYLKKIFMTLVIIPFLTNSLIRTYGIIILLRKEGIANALLQAMNITSGPINLMYNDFGIIFGMVYTLLPFMVLPLFSSVDKISPSIIEAASDLGANKKNIFKEISRFMLNNER